MEVVYKMNWNESTVFRFIELYRDNRCLWDFKDPDHKNRYEVTEAWEKIQKELGMPCTVTDLKKKKESLMSAYRSRKQKSMTLEARGKNNAPTWTFYEAMDSFLDQVYNVNGCAYKTRSEEISVDVDGDGDPDDDDGSEPKYYRTVQPSVPKKRRRPEPRQANADVEMSNFRNQPEETMNYAPHVTQMDDSDDECATFGLLITKKLRKLTENRRDIMMVRINQLFVDEYNERNAKRTRNFRKTVSPSTSFNNDPLILELKPDSDD